MNPPSYHIRPIDAAEARPLRHAILRPNQPFEATVYPLDDQPESGHFGAFLRGQLVGVASLYREAQPGETAHRAWRLRGMATDAAQRGCGIGSALMQACLGHVRTHSGTVLWFNARATAAAFYCRFGFTIQGTVFDLEGIGPHVVMTCVL